MHIFGFISYQIYKEIRFLSASIITENSAISRIILTCLVFDWGSDDWESAVLFKNVFNKILSEINCNPPKQSLLYVPCAAPSFWM